MEGPPDVSQPSSAHSSNQIFLLSVSLSSALVQEGPARRCCRRGRHAAVPGPVSRGGLQAVSGAPAVGGGTSAAAAQELQPL